MANAALEQMERRFWRQAILVTALLFFFFGVYNLGIFGAFTLKWLSQTIIGTSGLLFAMSLSLSTLSFYSRSFGSKVIYRKYLGLMGYFVALIDFFLLLYTDRDYYVFGLAEHFFTADVLLGFFAMGIFTVMALISNRAAIPLLGATRWRNILRLGYLALFLLVLRAAVIEGALWQVWIADMNTLPPVRLVISFLAISVLFGRLSLVFHQARAKTVAETVPQPHRWESKFTFPHGLI